MPVSGPVSGPVSSSSWMPPACRSAESVISSAALRVEVQDETGRRLGKARLPEGIEGIARLHAMIGQHVGDDEDEQVQVVVGIETERGPWVQALLAAGYQVYAINPLQ